MSTQFKVFQAYALVLSVAGGLAAAAGETGYAVLCFVLAPVLVTAQFLMERK